MGCSQSLDIGTGSFNPSDSLQNELLKDREKNLAGGVESLPRSTKINGRFVHSKDIFPDHVNYGAKDFFRWRRTVDKVPAYTEEELEEHLPVRQPDRNALETPPPGKLQSTWLGHACVLVQWDGWNVLADPVFSHRCSPVQFAGPARIRPSPIQADQLPVIDAIVISHDHYDHLDENTVKALAQLKPSPMWFVPLGMKSWMTSSGVHNVVEMDWSEKVTLHDMSSRKRPDLTVACLPCQHWCSRTATDKNKTLWASWICKTESRSFFFGGDTGYCPVFSMIGDAFGSVSLAALPIGAYGSAVERWFHKPNHMCPSEAVQVHQDLKCKQSVGIHWGTFPLTSEPIMEPPQKLEEAKKAAGLQESEFIVLEHGETRVFD